MDETRKLARFLSQLTYEKIPQEAIDRAKLMVLDQFGVELACAGLAWSKKVFELVKTNDGGKEESTVLCYGLRTSIEEAAFANASFGHGFEIDDADLRPRLHPGCVVVPPSLAMSEAHHLDGRKFITALVAGCEISSRIGLAIDVFARGFHGTPVLGTFAAAASVSKLLGQDEEKALNALSIAASCSSGLAEYSETGGEVKRVHAGFSVRQGIRASLLAQLGLTGPPTALEGKKGFCQAFSVVPPPLEEMTGSLGKEFRILSLGFKPYCACQNAHAAIDAAYEIRKRAGFSPEKVEEIVIGTNKHGIFLMGAVYEPKDITGAQFSLPFCVAMALVKGSNGFRDYTEEVLKDSQLLDLAGKVRLVEKQGMEEANGAQVQVRLKDGTLMSSEVVFAKGTVKNPMSPAELEEKFHDLASTVLPGDQIEQIIKMVKQLDKLEDVASLAALLKRNSE
jgi:2-methylcitrate dehydratase PrpD